ncbi:MAG: Crp/Fnr family transcriptional regulator [Rhodobacteraceae bacterium]|nr:Crp/Fnr family transcriptional regulator [Paracoccaceae bacterium]
MLQLFSTLFADARPLALATEQTLVRKGDPVRFIYWMVEGQVDLIRHTKAGACLVLHRAQPGQIIAEASLYSPCYHCDCTAMAPTRLRALPAEVFRGRLEDDPKLATAWAASLAHALQGARTSAEIRSLRTVAERLDAWQTDERPLPEKGQWKNLAHVLGVSQEALYREIAKRRS